MTGISDRSYYALVLDGRFYEPRNSVPLTRPHLEIPSRLLEKPDGEFPDRLAQAGNGLAFPTWIPAEAKAAKRSVFWSAPGSIGGLVDLLNGRRDALVDTVRTLSSTAAPRWSVIEKLLVCEADGLSSDATGDIDVNEFALFFPAGADMQLKATFDFKLRGDSDPWASRRLGIWRIEGVDDTGERFSLGVVTPRLTASSLFQDPLFTPDREAPAALLLRGVLLRRLIDRHLGGDGPTRVADPVKAPNGEGFRALGSRRGAKLPEASVAAAVSFLQAYPDADTAWQALTTWARRTGTLLTVTEDTFRVNHRQAARALRRAEDPSRDDINGILPVCWSSKGKVIRADFRRSTPK